MNIFVLNQDPIKAASLICKRHVIKMILESTQLLSTSHLLNGSRNIYRPSHLKHPCTLWAKTSRSNWNWLFNHAMALVERYEQGIKTHKCKQVLLDLKEIEKGVTFELQELTPFALAMANEYKKEDPIESYLTYYLLGKKHLLNENEKTVIQNELKNHIEKNKE
jgi:hypothetical protein